jgi:hypothetical protein
MTTKDTKFDAFVAKMKKTAMYAVAFYVLASAGLIYAGKSLWESHKQLGALQQEARNDEEIGRFALVVMDLSRAPLSKVQRQVTAQTIARVTKGIFSTMEERKAFTVLLAIESKFNRNAKSSAGAVGISQVIRGYAKEFGKKCGIVGLVDDDLTETETNMLVGACQFKDLLKSMDGVVELALVAYNAGSASKSINELRSLGSITNSEAANYIPKYSYLHAISLKKHKEIEAEGDK